MPEHSYSTAQGRNEEQILSLDGAPKAEDVGGGPRPGWTDPLKTTGALRALIDKLF